jgi:predicted  nucleic acid-binding Zn-ribbon protein
MTTQLPALLMLQEVDALIRDLADASWREAEAALGFAVGPGNKLRSERTRLAASLNPELLRRYEQLSSRHPRAVAPVRRGTCLGCFTVRPTVTATQGGRLETCERCGRILYRLEEPKPAAEVASAVRPGRKAKGRGRH